MFLKSILKESFYLLKEMSPYLLFGFLFAGLLRVFISAEKIASHLGKGKILSSIKASIMGIPLPLCSCGVIPAAISLRRQGANKGATLSFLISTPITGIDSILATYALLGAVFTIFRVAASFLIAIFCGIIANLLLREDRSATSAPILCNICGEEGEHEHGIAQKIRYMFHYAFVELLEDVGKWLLLGIIIGGIISYLVPKDIISRFLGSDIRAMLIMLLIGIPMYVCATGSIPIVAALMIKGMSPGAGLVFLLTGPATNTVTITVIAKELGKKAVALYILIISIASILSGLLLNSIWEGNKNLFHIKGTAFLPEWIKIASAILLLGLIIFSMLRSEKEGYEMKGEGIILNVPDMNCEHCVRSIKQALRGINVSEVEVDLKSKKVKVPSNVDKEAVIKAINSAGFKAYED